MKKYINLFLVGFLLIWVSDSASKRDKATVEELIYQLMLQPKIEHKISLTSLEKVSEKLTSKAAGCIWIINENDLRKRGVPVDELITYALRDLRNMKNRFDNVEHYQWKYGVSKEQILSDSKWVVTTKEAIP